MNRFIYKHVIPRLDHKLMLALFCRSISLQKAVPLCPNGFWLNLLPIIVIEVIIRIQFSFGLKNMECFYDFAEMEEFSYTHMDNIY
jgi:hypothetical protein